jgi:transposase-like protein
MRILGGEIPKRDLSGTVCSMRLRLDISLLLFNWVKKHQEERARCSVSSAEMKMRLRCDAFQRFKNTLARLSESGRIEPKLSLVSACN